MTDQPITDVDDADDDPLTLLTVRDVAALFRVPTSWVYDAAEDGRLPHVN